jgi:long-chain acyl-CoA synthetase
VNVGDAVRRAARLYPGRIAVRCGDRSLRAAEVSERATRLANALLGSGLAAGDRVAVLTPNCAENMEIEFGCALGGLVRVSLNVRLAEADLLAVMEAMGVRGLIYAGRFHRLAERFAADRRDPALLGLALDERDLAGGPGADYEPALSRASTEVPRAAVDERALYCLFSTSGTTGRPKGVMLTHRAQLAVATSLLLEYGPVRPGDSVLLPQPLSHGGGFFMLPYFLSGGCCVVAPTFGPHVFELAERQDVGTLKLVPTMLIDLLRAGAAPSRTYAPRKIIYGGAPMPQQWLKEALRVFGPVFLQLYGQAEAPMCISVLPEEEHRDERLLSSAGRPCRNVDVRVVDDADRDVEPGQPGEVIVRGDHMMDGYWGDEAQTARTLRGGYVRTRDTATVDEQGYLYLLGRSDEMINSGGFNIAPIVVERTLHEHPAIAEAAVVGVAHERWGEAVKAFVVLRPGARVKPEEIIEYCRPRLGMQRPQEVELVPSLPKNAYGKVVKSELTLGGEKPG